MGESFVVGGPLGEVGKGSCNSDIGYYLTKEGAKLLNKKEGTYLHGIWVSKKLTINNKKGGLNDNS